jgi:putative ABC transport system permease protein
VIRTARPAPWRIGRVLLQLSAGRQRAAEVEGDLVELFHARLDERGRRYAQWHWLMDAASVRRSAGPDANVFRAPIERGDRSMTVLWHDARAGVRSLMANARFSIIAIGLLALSIGVTAAVFSVVNAVLLRPLPYAEPDRLVAISGLVKTDKGDVVVPTVALADLERARPHVDTFASFGSFAYTQLPIRAGASAFSPVTAIMDPEFLVTLGRAPMLGTLFPAGDHPEAVHTAILSHALWTQALGADPAAVGKTLNVNGEPFVIRAVMPADFQFPRPDVSYFSKPVDLLLPALALQGFRATSQQFWGVGRLKPGVTVAQAEASLQPVIEGLAPAENGRLASVRVTSLADETTRKARQPLLVMQAIAIVLLLIAVTNLMNLYFARGVDRVREMSIRRALGSSTGQLVRLLIVESLMLSAAGAAIGVWLASLVTDGIATLSPLYLPVTRSINVDGTVLVFTLAIAVATAIVAGLLPALHVSARTREAMRHPGLRVTASRGAIRMQQTMCVAQIALGMALVAAAGLLARSLWALDHVDAGFDTSHVIGFNLSVPQDVPDEVRLRFYQSALDGVRGIAGVEHAGFISFLPPETRAGIYMGARVDGDDPATERPRRANTLMTSEDYFQTVRMPIVRGRDFSTTDAAGRPLVVVVNETFAKRYLGDGDPIGRRVGTGFDGMNPVRTVIGVVGDAHDRGVLKATDPTVYIPIAQFNLAYGAIALRSSAPVETLVPAIRERLQGLNAAVPLTDFQTLDQRQFASLREPRFYTLMAVGCAGLAVVFVTFGLYGLISYSVGRRRAELGIRIAVGAGRANIVQLVLMQGLRLAAIGIAVGLALTLATSRGLESQLYQVERFDPLTVAASALLVLAVALAASLGPARRASKADPLVALREQ